MLKKQFCYNVVLELIFQINKLVTGVGSNIQKNDNLL